MNATKQAKAKPFELAGHVVEPGERGSMASRLAHTFFHEIATHQRSIKKDRLFDVETMPSADVDELS